PPQMFPTPFRLFPGSSGLQPKAFPSPSYPSSTVAVICHPACPEPRRDRSGPIFSSAPLSGASGRAVEGSAFSLFLGALRVRRLPRPGRGGIFSLRLSLLCALCALCVLCVSLFFFRPFQPRPFRYGAPRFSFDFQLSTLNFQLTPSPP